MAHEHSRMTHLGRRRDHRGRRGRGRPEELLEGAAELGAGRGGLEGARDPR